MSNREGHSQQQQRRGGTMSVVAEARSSLALEEAQRHVLKVAWKREGDNLVFDPASLDTPLSRVLEAEEDIRLLLRDIDPEHRAVLEERVGERLEDLVLNARNKALQVIFDWLFGDADGPLPRKVLKRLYAFVRVFSPDHVWAMNQTDVGQLFGETVSAVCEREKQEIEAFMRLWNMTTWIASQGGKSAGARAKYAMLRAGNHSRKGGRKFEEAAPRRTADTDAEEEYPKVKGITPAMIAAMEENAERKRIAKLAGVKPGQIELGKTVPAREEAG